MERFIVVARRYLYIHPKHNGFVRLFISKRLIQGAAAALLGVFVPIYLYTITGENFYIVGGFYALLSLFYALLLVTGAKIMSKIGFRNALVLGAIFSVVLYTILYFMNEDNVWTLIIPFFIAILLFRIFHWVPYHVDFAVFTRDGERGRDVSLTFATVAFMGVIGPILAGYIISNSGYDTLFLIAIILLGMSVISYSFVPKTGETYEWTFIETWQKFFSREYRPIVLGMFAEGAEVVVTVIVWPIFLYEILSGNVFEIGAVSTLVTGATIIIQLAIGRYLDRGTANKTHTLRVGSTLYAIGWIIKIFVLSAAQIFFVGLYHNVTKIFTRTPFNAIFYDMSADQGHYVDEFTVLREMASHMGRFISLCAIVALTLFIPIQWTFLIGAAATLLLNAIYRGMHT